MTRPANPAPKYLRSLEAVSRLWTVWSKAGGPVSGAIAVEYDTAARICDERRAAGHANERPVRCRAALAINDDGSIAAATLIYPKR